ncbi:uncharacterized protein [Branchiostoma lanceolatum]|uniref:uncharacterized protein isoform X2 n=1 Tax=Branchiostoma lanceolatum TaxID=7740 RepID=UPI00345465CE
MSSAGFQRNNGRRNFQVFYTNKRPEIARKYPFLGAKQIQRKVEELWRSLDPGEKEEFRVVSPAVANNFRRKAWQEEGEKSLTSRAGELEEPSNSGYCETISVSDYEGDQQQEVDVHHSTSTTNNEFELTFVCKTDKKSTENTLERTTTWEKKPYRHAGLDLCSEAESDHHYYLPRTARNRTKSSSRSKGVLTLHMAKMQMVATTSAGIGKGEITRTSNSESEGISCSEDWFDQDIVTEQLPENKRSYIGDDTTSVGQAPPMDEIVESTDFVNTDKDVTEAGDAKDEDNNVERNEDGGEHILSLESKKAITQYLNGSGLNGTTFNTSTSEDEKEECETKILIESAINSLETNLSGDNENIGPSETGQCKCTSDYAESVHDRASLILSEIINEAAQNADTHTATYGKAVKHGHQSEKENIRGHEYDPGDNRSKTAQVVDGIFPITSDETRDSGSELWDSMFWKGTPLKSKRRYTRKRSSFSESGDVSEVETAVEMWLTGHSDGQQKAYRDITGMQDTSEIVNTPSGDVNTNRPEQNATQDTTQSTKQRECCNTVNEENKSELRTRENMAAKIDTCKLTPSFSLDGEESKVNVEEDNQCIIDEALPGTINAHHIFQSTPSHWEQPATSNVHESHQITQGGKHSMAQQTGNTHLDSSHMKSASLNIPIKLEQHVDKQTTRKSSGDETDSTKTRAMRRGTPRPAENTMVRLLTRDYNMTTRAQSRVEKRNTRNSALDYRRLSGIKNKQQKTRSKRNWQRNNSKDSILSCDSGQRMRTPRQRGKKRKRHLSTSSVGSDFSTTSSVPELQENYQWEDMPTEESEMRNDKTKETRVKDGMDSEDFCIQQDKIISANVSPVAVCHLSVPPVEKFDEQIDEKGEETRIPDVESKETVDPDKQLERQEDDPWDMHTEETEQGGHLKQENHGDHETVPSSSGGFLCELFSDHKPNTGAWLPGFNRSVPDCPESDANFIDIEDDGIFL